MTTRLWTLGTWLSSLLLALSVFGCRCGEELRTQPPAFGSLRGVVCASSSGAATAGIAVVIIDSDGTEHAATSDGFGSFRVDELPPGDAQLIITDAGGDRRFSTVIVSDEMAIINDNQCRAPGEPPPPPPPADSGTVAGCICDTNAGQWVSGATVFINLEGSLVATTTDGNGCFTLAGVPVGSHELNMEWGATARVEPITVAANATTTLPAPATCELPPPPPPDESGSIQGHVCAPDGQTWLSAADVYVERADGTRAVAVTDANGSFLLEGVPDGVVIVHIVKGSFEDTREVTVVAGQTTVIPEDDCVLDVSLRVAVVSGAYDHVELVLSSLGVDEANITVFDGTATFPINWDDNLLNDYAALSQFDIVFLNCGIQDRPFTTPGASYNPTAIANLRQFVQDGGSVYGSDWAYNIIELTWPEYITFEGSDATVDAAKVGIGDYSVTGTIVDAAMATALGQSSVELFYALAQWVPMSAVANNVTVYVRGDALVTLDQGMTTTTRSNVPHTVSFRPGSGRVLYTSFHQEDGATADMLRILQLLMFEL